MKPLLVIIFTITLSSCVNGNAIEKTNNTNSLSAEVLDQSIDSIEISNSSSGIAWEKEYNRTLSDVLSLPSLSSLFSAEINGVDLKKVHCQNFNSLSKKQKTIFYIVFLAAIAEQESDFDNNNRTYNKSDDTWNVGLFQIDPASSNRHAKSVLGKVTESDLTSPSVNLMAASFIFKNQISGGISKNPSGSEGRLFPTHTYFWEVLTTKSKKIINFIQENKANLKFCV
jgi:hypothetical protein